MTTDSPLRQRLRTALLDARRARDAAAVSVVRSALAALENAEAERVYATHAPGRAEAARAGIALLGGLRGADS